MALIYNEADIKRCKEIEVELEKETELERNTLDVNDSKKKHFCYIIYDDFGSTYNGYTCYIKRRIRQHNNQIKGGALFTTRRQRKTNDNNHWKYLLAITSEDEAFDYKKALSLEWSIKNPTNRRTRPKRNICGRILSLPLVFSNNKFSHLSFNLIVHHPLYFDMIKKTLEPFPNVKVCLIDDQTSHNL